MAKKIYLDAGHGGKDSGALGGGFKEKDFTLEMAKACRDYLNDNYTGISVKLSRTTDRFRELNDVCNEINAWGADIAVSFHINAGGGDGCEAWISKGSVKGKKLADCILDEIVKLNQKNRGIKHKLNSSGTDWFAFNRIPRCPSIIIEPFFIDSVDRKIGDTKSERTKIAQAIAKGIAKHLGLKKKTAPVKTLKVGSKVRIKAGATDLNTKKKFSSFVYENTYTVISITASRVVFGLNGKVTGVAHKDNITLV